MLICLTIGLWNKFKPPLHQSQYKIQWFLQKSHANKVKVQWLSQTPSTISSINRTLLTVDFEGRQLHVTLVHWSYFSVAALHNHCNAACCCRKSVYHSALALFKRKLQRKWVKCQNGQCECASGKIQTQTNDKYMASVLNKVSPSLNILCATNKPALNTELIQRTAHKL